MVASNAGKLGSIDANTGDPLLGWDTDQFPVSIYDAVYAMLIVLKQGGLAGGLNFDAKARRGSVDTLDLFYAHIGAMDNFARGLLIADKIITDGCLDGFVEERYSSWNSALGKQISSGKASFDSIEQWLLANGEPVLKSGRQEYLENIINQYIFTAE
jgi:xylose isomerase